jgi:DNA mismatch endonuclease (patch repair protein)
MARVRSRNTAPENTFRKALWAEGLRYRIHADELPGEPDVVIPKKRLAIFVDGDYWHGGQWIRRGLTALEDQFPDTPSKSYWLKKIRRNMERDCVSTAALLRDGWIVLRFWESDVKKHLVDCVKITVEAATTPPPPTRFAFLPDKTFLSAAPLSNAARQALEDHGWKALFVAGRRGAGMSVGRNPVSMIAAVRDHDVVVGQGTRLIEEPHERERLTGFLRLARLTPAPLCLYEAPSPPSFEDIAQSTRLSCEEAGYSVVFFAVHERTFVVGVRGALGRLPRENTEPENSLANPREQDLDALIPCKTGWISRLSAYCEDIAEAPGAPLGVIAKRVLNPLVNELIRGRALVMRGEPA